MKVLVGIAGGWIGFSLADKALFDGGMTRLLISLVRYLAARYGLHF
jgi:hypothetical protein